MLIKKIFVSLVLFLVSINSSIANEIKIVSKVGNEIITNIDIENEKKYLLLLNDNLNKLTKKEFFNLARNSLIREKIKNNEIKRLFPKKNDIKFEERLVEDFYKRLGFVNKEDFINFLNNKNLLFGVLKKKLISEGIWNQIIFAKYRNRIKIDNKDLEEKIKKQYETQTKKYEYKLSEILFEPDKNMSLKINEIKKYIEEFGFKIAANKYSKSNTSKFGGEIGWVKSTRLSKLVKKNISQIKIGEITEAIQTPNGYLILKLDDSKEVKEKLNLQKELKLQIQFERNRQLNQFSLNYYKKLRQNTNIVYENK
tara:strand:- start:2352 stop:3284 length:933 start_codon:yes stop_codon:yes gene_type:complete